MSCVGLKVTMCCAIASLLHIPGCVMLAQAQAEPARSLTVVIRGGVVDSAGSPVANVLITAVSDLHRTTRQSATDAQGKFRLDVPTTTGGFTIILSGAGIAERVIRATGRLTIDLGQIVVQRTPHTLPAVRVRASRIERELPGAGPGTSQKFRGSELFSDYLTELQSLDAIGSLVAGFFAEIQADGLTRLTVPGAGSTQNSITLDGSRYDGMIPRDAIASAIVGSTADATRGRFAGADVSAQTAKGTGIPRLAMRSTFYSPSVSSTQAYGTRISDAIPLTLGITASGPLQDKLRFFAAAEIGRRATPSGLVVLDGHRPSVDSAAKLLETLDQLGIPTHAPVRKGTTFASGLLNLSYSGGRTSSGNVRVNGYSSLGPSASAFSLSTAGSTLRRDGVAIHADFTRAIRGRILHESRFAMSGEARSQDPLLDFSRGEVRVGRAGDAGFHVLTFGGSGFPAQRRDAGSIEAATAFSWEQATQRFKLGVDARRETVTRLEQQAGSGTFLFASVADLAASQAIRFTRIERQSGDGQQSDINLFGNHLWTARDGLQLQSGLRMEAATLSARGTGRIAGTSDPVSSTVETSELALLPRAAAVWRYGTSSGGRPLGEVRFAAGGYRGLLPLDLAEGIAGGAASVLSCSGGEIPPIHWREATVSNCMGTETIVRESATFSSDLKAPVSWRSTVEISLPTKSRAALTLRGLVSRTSHVLDFIDINARPSALSSLPGEGGRPLYVSPFDINPATGIPNIRSSRLDTELGQRIEYRSDLVSNARQLMVELWVPPAARGGARWQATYAYTRVTDSRRRSDRVASGTELLSVLGATDRRHQFHVLATAPSNRFAVVNLLGTIASGAPFTPLVRGDIDGDGFHDDPAFVFGEASPDASVRASLNLLRRSGARNVRRCLDVNANRVAALNSCRSPWSSRVDMIARLRPNVLGMSKRATVEVRATNIGAGLYRVLHRTGSGGWGSGGFVDPALLIPRGFDPVANRYEYVVNANFGKPISALDQFRLSIDVRVALGPDPQRSNLLALIGRGPRQKTRPTVAELEQNLAMSLPNPMRLVLARRDSLRLTQEQVARIEAMNLAYQAEVKELVGPLAAELARLPEQFQSHDIVARVNEAFFDLQRRQMRWGDEIHDILSPGQRQKLPLYVQHVIYDSYDEVETILR